MQAQYHPVVPTPNAKLVRHAGKPTTYHFERSDTIVGVSCFTQRLNACCVCLSNAVARLWAGHRMIDPHSYIEPLRVAVVGK